MRPELIILAATLIAPASVGAQTDTSATWPVGSRVRLWTSPPDRKVVGQLKEVRGDTLVMETPGIFRSRQSRVLGSSAVRIDVSDGKRMSGANIALGTLGGAGLGVVVTAVLDNAFGDFCPLGECTESGPDYARAALLGAAAGAIAGALKLEDQWREVPVPGRLTIAPTSRRTVIGFSFAFR